LDPFFASARPALPPSPPPPHLLPTRTRNHLLTSHTRKHLTIAVPPPPPPTDATATATATAIFADRTATAIFADRTAWAPPPAPSTLTPAASTLSMTPAALSPPRLPESPRSAGDGVGGARSSLDVVAPSRTVARDASETPAIVVSALSPVPAIPPLTYDAATPFQFPSHAHDDNDTASEESFPRLRSRWSSSTLADDVDARALADDVDARALGVLSPRLLSFRIARRVGRAKRAPVVGPRVPVEVASPRASCESEDGASESGDSTSSSGLRRKAIPVELFMR
ncbi:hypothetical protein K488DRAFT_92222, partial [Vararia minispora EC-137]